MTHLSDEMAKLKRRLIVDCRRAQVEDSEEMADGLRIALFEIDHLDKPYNGEEEDNDD